MNVHLGGDDVGALVMEMGSAYAKAGYAGDDSPKAVFPSVRTTLKFVRETVYTLVSNR